MKNIDLVQKVKEVGVNNKELQASLEWELAKALNCDADVKLCEKVRRFLRTFKKKFEKHHRVFERFEKNESEWLSSNFFEELEFQSDTETINDVCDTLTGCEVTSPMGRPTKEWNDLSDRTKRRKMFDLAASSSTKMLSSAAV